MGPAQRRWVIEAAVAVVAWILAGVGLLLGRNYAATTLGLGGAMVLTVELIYSMNTSVSPLFGRAGRSTFVRASYLAGAAFSWGLAGLVILLGVAQLVTGRDGY